MSRYICLETPNGANALQLRKRETPSPGAGEVLIKQTKLGLNFLDIYQTTGAYPFPENGVLIPGNEGVGIILSCGEGVNNFNEGDRVGYPMTIGAFAEERVICSERVIHLPDTITDEAAAASMLKGMTVEYLFNQSTKLREGDKVLFHAAAGGVGLIAGQWLNAIGVESIGTVGTQAKQELAQNFGYTHVLNYNEVNFAEAVMDLTNGKGVKVVFDSVGKDTYPMSLKVLENCGLFVAFGASSGVANDFCLADLQKNGSLYAQRPTLATYIATSDQLKQSSKNLFKMLETGKIKVSINQKYNLENTADAFNALTSRKTSGASIIDTGL